MYLIFFFICLLAAPPVWKWTRGTITFLSSPLLIKPRLYNFFPQMGLVGETRVTDALTKAKTRFIKNHKQIISTYLSYSIFMFSSPERHSVFHIYNHQINMNHHAYKG